MIVNTCVVRQSAEDRGLGRLGLLSKIKRTQPDKVIGVMGCMVGVRDPLWMRQRLPYVDVFMPPSNPAPMVDFLKERMDEADVLALEADARSRRDALQDGELVLPSSERGTAGERSCASCLWLFATPAPSASSHSAAASNAAGALARSSPTFAVWQSRA